MLYLLCNPHCQCFVPFLDNFHYLFSRNSIDSEVKDTYDPATDDGTDLWLVIWNDLPRLPKRCMVYNMDPMVPHIERGFRDLLARSPGSTIVQFLDYSGNNHTQIADLNLNWGLLNYGHSPYHAHLKGKYVSSQIHQDIDLLFYGNVMQPRRARFIQVLMNLCQQRKYRFVIRHYDLFNEAEKVNLIAQAKIVISFASEDTLKFRSNDLARSAQVISSGGFMMDEFTGDAAVEDKLSQYVAYYSTLEECLSKVDYYLQHPQARATMVAKAQQQFPQDFNLERDLLTAVQPHL